MKAGFLRMSSLPWNPLGELARRVRMCSEMGNVSRGVCRAERYGVPAGVRTLSPLYVSFSGNVLRRGRKIVLCFFCGAGAHALTKGASEVSAHFRALPFVRPRSPVTQVENSSFGTRSPLSSAVDNTNERLREPGSFVPRGECGDELLKRSRLSL